MKLIYYLCLLNCLLFSKEVIAKAQPLELSNQNKDELIFLREYYQVAKADTDVSDAQYYYSTDFIFKPFSAIKELEAGAVYWVKMPLVTAANLRDNRYVLSFSNLTFVDLYLYEGSELLTHKKNGAFRPRSQIFSDDKRFQFSLDLEPSKEYTLLFRVEHIKGYTPYIDFYLENWSVHGKLTKDTELSDAFLLGAVIALLIYIALSWIVTRFRPYIWIFCFLLSLGLYSYALHPEFIDYFFPEDPKLGWALLPSLQRLGTISFYLLMIDFLNLKKLSISAYKGAIIIMSMVAFLSAISFIYSYHTGNFRQTNVLTFAMGVINISFLTITFIRLWPKIDKTQKFLVFGIVLFVVGILVLIFGALLFKERLLLFIPMITLLSISVITILFLIGIRLKLRMIEEEQIELLEDNNRMQKEYNESIEQKVMDRTAELLEANLILEDQRIELLEKNQFIETLIDEVNHRVKNNLQLLYSLSSMSSMEKEEAPAMLSMRDRIRAMMLVNQLLLEHKGEEIDLEELVLESARKLQYVYDPGNLIHVHCQVEPNCCVQPKVSLPLGIILTELITNSYKYAFLNGKQKDPTIFLHFWKAGEILHFVYEDNAIDVSVDRASGSLGISLIKDLVRQVKGTIVLNLENRFCYEFKFPLNYGFTGIDC